MKNLLETGSENINGFALRLKACLERKKPIIIVGNCKVDYVGRARSTLEYGDRIILIKSDGSLIVHRPHGYQPVNWQPAGCIFNVKRVGGTLFLRAVRDKPHESVNITFKKIYLLEGFQLEDMGEFSLYASEFEMKEAINMKPDLIEPGFKVLKPEKQVPSGFVDLYGVDKDGRVVIVELKRKPADRSAVLQLSKYIESIEGKETVRGVIAAPGLAKGVQKLIDLMNLEFKHVEPKKCAEILSKRKDDLRPLSDYI
jgi:RecB family endonuclease NucS